MKTATSQLYAGALGVHAPDRLSGREFSYPPGGLREWLKLTGRTNGGGAPCHWKIYDDSWRWAEGALPEWQESHHALIEDCRVLNFKPLVAYCPFTSGRPGSELDLQGYRSGLSLAMKKFMQALPRGSAVIFGNERENAWNGDPVTWFELEAEFGYLAKQYGHDWYVGADMVQLNTLQTFTLRQEAWKRYGIEPVKIVFHGYGQGGFLARHVVDIFDALKRITGRAWNLIWTEWGWGFPGKGKTRADRRDLDQANTGAYCGEMALKFAAIEADGCAFTLDQHFNNEGEPTAAAEEFSEVLKTGKAIDPRVPPAPLSRSRTFAYLSAGRSALGRAYARTMSLIS